MYTFCATWHINMLKRYFSNSTTSRRKSTESDDDLESKHTLDVAGKTFTPPMTGKRHNTPRLNVKLLYLHQIESFSTGFSYDIVLTLCAHDLETQPCGCSMHYQLYA